MSGIVTIIVSIVLFLILITIHEFGHFALAKLTGIKVNEFSVGMGPKIYQKRKGETLYSLRALPIGGYCAMEGEGEESDDPRAFINADPWKKFLTILAGPLMNIFLAIVIFTITVSSFKVTSRTIDNVLDDSPAQKAGFVSGDEIIEIDGEYIKDFEDLVEKITNSDGKELSVSLVRKNREMKLLVEPEYNEGRYMLGITPKQESFKGNPLNYAFVRTGQIFKALFDFLVQLFTGRMNINSVSGPVGVVSAIASVSKLGWLTLLDFFGYISLNLAFFNLLPIPALDGSQLVYIIIEKIRGKRLKTETIAKINLFGFIFLLSLILVVSIKDIYNLF